MPMSTTWASKISRILSPTRSYMACMSSSEARPCWTPLMMAGSAAPWSVSVSSRFVSSKRRAFSRATPMLEARVARRRASAVENAYFFRLSSAITPSTRSPARIGTPSHDSVLTAPPEMAPAAGLPPPGAGRGGRRGWGGVRWGGEEPRCGERLLERAESQRSLGRDDDRAESLAQFDRFDLEPLAVVVPVREADLICRPVIQRDEHVAGLGGEDRPQPLPDQLDDGLEVELLGERAADLVDQRQFRRALVRFGQQALRLVEQAGVGEGHAPPPTDSPNHPLLTPP